MKITFWSVLLFFLLVSSTPFAQDGDEEPLHPDAAFSLKTYALDANTIRAEWQIAEGYYLYRDKFKFVTEAADISIESAIFPKGKLKEDEFFGKIESYRNKVAIDIPLLRGTNSADSFILKATSQGCADIGICYPPQTKEVSIVMPPPEALDLPASSAVNNSSSLLSKIGQSLGLIGNQKEFLPPDEAFVFTAEGLDGNRILATWEIEDGYYLYRDKFSFELENAPDIQLAQPQFPKGKRKFDEAFGDMVVYYDEAVIPIPVARSSSAVQEVTLVANFQGCADDGFCYPPTTKKMALSLPAGDIQSLVSLSSAGVGGQTNNPVLISEQDQIAQSLASDSLWLVVLTFFGFGLLLSFTPCVFPMVPILSSIIVGQGKQVTTQKALVMSIVYVLAMALTYTVAGIFAGLFGENLQAMFQNPWVLSVFSVVFVLLALSMFGFYDLQLPASWQSKLSELSNRQEGGKLAGVAIMGFLSALIVGPCVAAPLAGALIYIGQTGDAWLGGMALFALSLGMGAPLIVIGASAGKLLPKAGVWMDAVKAVFGVLLLAVAIWMLERILPIAVSMMLWAALLIISAIYMGALSQFEANSSGWHKLWKGTGLVILIYGGLLIVGVATGGGDVLQPLRGLSLANQTSVNGQASTHEVDFKVVKTSAALDAAIQAANAQGRPVMLDFYADWCVSCKEMERYTFADPSVRSIMEQGLLLQADVTANDDDDKALLKRFNLFGPPSILFFGLDGQEKPAYRVVGFMKAEDFSRHIQQAFDVPS